MKDIMIYQFLQNENMLIFLERIVIKMLRIPINDANKSDVIGKAIRGGWRMSIYHDGGKLSYLHVVRGTIEFTLKQLDKDTVELKKFIDNTCVDTKTYGTDGVENCEGTLLINEHSDPKRCYAFWRNRELYCLMESCGVLKLMFAKTSEATFEYEIDSPDKEGFKFYTDGQISRDDDNKIHIFGATYLFKQEEKELIVSHSYNIEELSKSLIKEIYG